MSTDTLGEIAAGVLAQARRLARAQGLAYAGDVTPVQAWALAQSGQAVLVDVRSAEERRFVGHVPGSVHVPWATGVALQRNARFVEQLEAVAGRSRPLLLLCRSARRSVSGAEAATRAGFEAVYNVLEGFEGDADAVRQRGHLNGWRRQGLPWEQD